MSHSAQTSPGDSHGVRNVKQSDRQKPLNGKDAATQGTGQGTRACSEKRERPFIALAEACVDGLPHRVARRLSTRSGDGGCGRQPDFGGYLDRTVAAIQDRGGPVNEDEQALVQARYYHLYLDLTRAEETRRMFRHPLAHYAFTEKPQLMRAYGPHTDSCGRVGNPAGLPGGTWSAQAGFFFAPRMGKSFAT